MKIGEWQYIAGTTDRLTGDAKFYENAKLCSICKFAATSEQMQRMFNLLPYFEHGDFATFETPEALDAFLDEAEKNFGD